MRVAQVAPLRVAVPPRDYGGTERCISNITEALVELGHKVTLYASGDSQTKAKLVAPIPEALGFNPSIDAVAHHVAMLGDVYRHSHHYDVIHSHLDYQILPFAMMSDVPTVTTLHGRLDLPDFARVFRAYPDANYVSISKSQQSQIPDINWVGTVYHSVDVDSFMYYPEPGKYLAFVGRISPEKRPDRAIEIAKMTGIPLIIAAKVDPADRVYFEQVIEPMLNDPLITFIGPVNEERKREIMGNALALLVPIDWPEPFGMVFIEALACGTPVLTCPCGSVPELLEDGVTGYVKETVAELAEAALMIRTNISRAKCRDYAKKRFDIRRLALDYLNVYAKISHRKINAFMPDVAAQKHEVATAVLAQPYFVDAMVHTDEMGYTVVPTPETVLPLNISINDNVDERASLQ